VTDVWTTPERLALRESAAGFVRRHVTPGLAEWEEAGEVPRALHREAAAAGLLGLGLPAGRAAISSTSSR
jgi:acyl-CoA dehydrogenase